MAVGALPSQFTFEVYLLNVYFASVLIDCRR